MKQTKKGFLFAKGFKFKTKSSLVLVLACFVEWTPTFLFLPDCSALHWPFAMYYIFYLFQKCFQTFLKLSLIVQPTVVKKRQKFGDVVKDIFPSQWFFHALYKKTGWRDMRPPRSDFLWNWLAHMTQIVSVEPNWDISRVSNIESDNS